MERDFSVRVHYAAGEGLYVLPYSYSYNSYEGIKGPWRVVYAPNQEFAWQDVDGNQAMLRAHMIALNT